MTKMQELSMRQARADDIEFVCDCAQQAYELYVADIGQKPAPMVADFPAHLDSDELYILYGGDQSVGFIVWWLNDDDLFIDNIAILPSQQSKGIARFCFDLLEEIARQNGKSALKLYTNEKMYGNLKLYPRLGFEEIHRISEKGFNRVYFRKAV